MHPPERGDGRARVVAIVLAAAFCVVGTIGAVGSWVVYRLDGAIARGGERADGHVTRKSLVYATDGDSDYTVDYWFVLPSGARIEATRGIRKALWATLREGDVVAVRYSAANPRRNFPERDGPPGVGVTAFVSLLCATLAAFGALVIAGLVRRRGDGPLTAAPAS
jgi:hypothetical protein